MNNTPELTAKELSRFLAEHHEELVEGAMAAVGLAALLLAWLARYALPFLRALVEGLQPAAEWLEGAANRLLATNATTA